MPEVQLPRTAARLCGLLYEVVVHPVRAYLRLGGLLRQYASGTMHTAGAVGFEVRIARGVLARPER